MDGIAYDYDTLGLSDETQRMLMAANGQASKAALLKIAALEARIAELEARQVPEGQLPSWWNEFILRICELPDRDSPDDWPEALIATAKELEACAINAMEHEREGLMTAAPSTTEQDEKQ